MKHAFILLLIIGLASFLRLWHLSSFPSGLNADEAALGYNAYSIMLTGKDEHGHAWPVNLESFGDFKPAAYAYLLIPFVKVLGLTAFAVRVPSALFAILAVYLIYLFVKEIWDKETGLVAAAILAVLPWHIHFSRGAWEVNTATTLILLGMWAGVRWVKAQRFSWLATCVLALVLSIYTYQSARLIAPILGLSLVFIYRRHFKKQILQVGLAAILLAITLIPFIGSIITSDAGSRLAGVGLLSDIGPVNRVNELRGQYVRNVPPIFSKILYNRVTAYSIQFVVNYLSHFDGNFLFVNGDVIERNKTPETGLLYLTDFILIGAGIVIVVKRRNEFTPLIWTWLFFAPIAAAATFQVPHALRVQNMLIPLVIIMAAAIREFTRTKKPLIVIGLVVVFGYQISRYLHEYYVHYPKQYPAAWEYGFQELVSYINDQENKYDQIIVTDKYDQPYILFLFYQKYPPSIFQTQHSLSVRDKFNFSTVREYGKFHFRPTAWEEVKDLQNVLIVAPPEDVPLAGANVINTISFPNGEVAFKIIAN